MIMCTIHKVTKLCKEILILWVHVYTANKFFLLNSNEMQINYYHFQYLTLMTEMNEQKTSKFRKWAWYVSLYTILFVYVRAQCGLLRYDNMKSCRVVPTLWEQTAVCSRWTQNIRNIHRPTRLTGVRNLEDHNANLHYQEALKTQTSHFKGITHTLHHTLSDTFTSESQNVLICLTQ
jgi:hypothetical protein